MHVHRDIASLSTTLTIISLGAQHLGLFNDSNVLKLYVTTNTLTISNHCIYECVMICTDNPLFDYVHVGLS